MTLRPSLATIAFSAVRLARRETMLNAINAGYPTISDAAAYHSNTTASRSYFSRCSNGVVKRVD